LQVQLAIVALVEMLEQILAQVVVVVHRSLHRRETAEVE
jgi:hypothetical protein